MCSTIHAGLATRGLQLWIQPEDVNFNIRSQSEHNFLNSLKVAVQALEMGTI